MRTNIDLLNDPFEKIVHQKYIIPMESVAYAFLFINSKLLLWIFINRLSYTLFVLQSSLKSADHSLVNKQSNGRNLPARRKNKSGQ